MAVSLFAVLIIIISPTVGGKLFPQRVMPMLEHANNLDLKPGQQAAGRIYRDIQAFTHPNPDTPPTQALLMSQGYVSEDPEVVWAFHTYGGPANRETCVIAYLGNDTTDYNADNPAAYDSLYEYGSIGQSCKHQVSGSTASVPDWTSG